MKRNRILGTAILIVVAAVTPSVLSAQSGAPGASTDVFASLVLRPADAVRVEVWRRPDLSGQFKVGVNGKLLHPLFQDIQAAGVPFDEVQRTIGEFLERHEANPRFVVEPLYNIRLGGEVNSPHVVAVPPETTVHMAIWGAGGPTDRGRMDHVRLVRDGTETVLDLTSSNGVDGDRPVRSGDQIVVGRSRSIFRDYVVPISSVTSAVYSIVRFTRLLR